MTADCGTSYEAEKELVWYISLGQRSLNLVNDVELRNKGGSFKKFWFGIPKLDQSFSTARLPTYQT
jgi:hypothetical protein